MEEDGRLTADEVDEVRRAAGIFTARRDDRVVYLLLEASRTVHRTDVRRAIARAALLARTGTPTLPVVAGETVAHGVADEATAAGAWVVTNGSVLEPAA
jgi:uncharacterized membrane protein (DUF2068 family)